MPDAAAAARSSAATYRSPGGRSSPGLRSPGSRVVIGLIVAATAATAETDARLRLVSHPSLGLPPVDRTDGLPPDAARVHASRDRIAARALEIAIDRDPSLRDRYDAIGLRRLLRDTAALLDRVVEVMATGDTEPARTYAEAIPPMFRRRRVP